MDPTNIAAPRRHDLIAELEFGVAAINQVQVVRFDRPFENRFFINRGGKRVRTLCFPDLARPRNDLPEVPLESTRKGVRNRLSSISQSVPDTFSHLFLAPSRVSSSLRANLTRSCAEDLLSGELGIDLISRFSAEQATDFNCLWN